MKAVAEGEAVEAHTNDLIATPSWGWHGHKNEGDETALWFSVLDLSMMLEGLHLTGEESWNEVYPEGDKDPIYRPAGYHNRRYSGLLPSNEEPGDNTVPYRFAWEDCYERLQEAAEEDDADDPYDGVTLEYVNPATGTPPVAPSMSMRLQLLDADDPTEAHRHNSVEAYYVMQGSGETVVGDETLEWGHKDVFMVPPMSLHHHVAAEDDTVLYAVSDEPMLKTFHLYREYDADDEPVDLPGVLANHDKPQALMGD
jgi:gentisate 1,2-dioxygenase